ncbi:2-oxoglutarate ferredoxin oxidoreductase subunit gamma [Dethiosulfatibacter aminovorans DSM 17477]|uniref:2-oxoglutarate ferredoxin oxidoreductase subunit gamma n=1 Tax=Dethiosulfatibacter aminovorans DSM 17477 TaxID=1121476 RepID=A0A1M6B219_9FIRM|nr:2-oxoacid:acceptor oxidoreductase family protein [Dethiosulfatibacter aminovorans]SHI42794.1 2-oxoglutarate ferredoxin oxidoreductase subunit gamma [Dethiosulfatibacter aminovorans DSM 17477]
MPDIICAGFGGQGVLTAGLILAKTGMNNDKNVTWIPSYGSEMRGGTANCNLKISDGRIASPFVKKIDILVAMNTPSVDKFEPMLKEGGTLVVNETLVKYRKFRDDVNVVMVPATDIAEWTKNPRGANIVMLGALASTGKLFDHGIMLSGVNEFFKSKGKNNPLNAVCFREGMNKARNLNEY